MNRLFNALASWSVDHRWPTLLLMAFLTAGSVVGFVAPELAELADFDDQVETGKDDEKQTKEPTPKQSDGRGSRRPRSSGGSMFNADSILVIDSPNFFTEEGTRALRQVVADVEALDYVSRVTWPDSVPLLNIFGLAEPLFPRPEASDRRFAAAKERALANPLIKGQMLSQNAETMLMLVSFDFDFVFSDEQVTTELKETAEAAAAKFPEAELRFQVTGSEPAIIAAISQHESNQLTFLSIGFGMVALMSIILFRGINTVVIVSTAPIVGVAWTLGMIRFVEYSEGNGLINVVLPVLVALVGITDGVHLMVQTRKLRAAGLSVREAARRGLQQVGLACFLTSFTTAVGFGSLMLAESSFVQDFGKCAVIGVTMSFLSVVTIIPLLCSTRLGRNIHVGLENSPIDRNLGRIGGLIDIVLRHRQFLSITGIVATIALFAICMTLEPDSRQRDNLPAKAEATLAMQHVDDAMGGMETSRIDVYWPNDMNIDDPQILYAVMAVDEVLSNEKLVGHPLSIRNLIDAQPGSGPPEERMSMLELLPPPIKDLFISPDDNKAIVTFKVKDLGIAAYGPVFERFEAAMDELKADFPGFDFKLEGGAAWRWRNLYKVVVDLAASLGTASLIIFGVMAFVFRSVRIGLISVIPNTFPLVVAGAWLVFAGYNLEIVMVVCFTVCLGIAVDDSIHFLTRFHEELESTGDVDEAIRRAFTGVGTALIMTTLVLVAGFTTVMFSNNREYFIFAVMGAITIAAALFADLIFLPPLLARFAPRTVAAGSFTAADGVEYPGAAVAAETLAESQPL
jgi:predicted RND superfamily exporter protein